MECLEIRQARIAIAFISFHSILEFEIHLSFGAGGLVFAAHMPVPASGEDNGQLKGVWLGRRISLS